MKVIVKNIQKGIRVGKISVLSMACVKDIKIKKYN